MVKEGHHIPTDEDMDNALLLLRKERTTEAFAQTCQILTAYAANLRAERMNEDEGWDIDYVLYMHPITIYPTTNEWLAKATT
jgi:hypothetical protein